MSGSQWERRRLPLLKARSFLLSDSTPSVCSFGIDLRVNAVASVRHGGHHRHVCVRARRTHTLRTLLGLYTKARRVCNRWTSGLTRTWCATRRGGRESILNVRSAVARIYMHAYAHACAQSGLCIEERESKGLPAGARAQSVAAQWDYLYQKLAEINSCISIMRGN